MDLRVTIDTGRDSDKVALPMTLKTEGLFIGDDQKKSIGRPMRHVADAASFHLHRHMLKDPGTPLLCMAFKTDIVIRKFVPFLEACPRPGPVGGMAVRAFHCPLHDSMIDGKIEFGLYVLMARKAEIGLLIFQQFLGDPGFMNLVAVIAAHGAQLVDPPVELEKFPVLGVAIEADVGPGLCILILERKDKPFPFGLCMFFSRAMAGFASFLFFADFRIDNALPVRSVFLEVLIEVFMAILAGLGSDISSLLLFCLVLAEGSKTEKKEDDDRDDYPYHQIPASTHKRSPSLNDRNPSDRLLK
jgi:hypothetical protein